VIGVCAIWIRTAAQLGRAMRRSTLWPALVFALAALAAAGPAAAPADGSTAASTLEQEALPQAQLIRAEVTARYRPLPGRRLVVTEATGTGVVGSLTLITDWLEPWRVVPADNGIYYAICSARAKCPYPARTAARPVEALLPRRMALELALRTLLETSVDLVVVALPSARPVWVVVERDDPLASVDTLAVLDELRSTPAVIDPSLRELVDRLTRPRLFVPLPILPPPDDTIYAVTPSLTNP
jgi:hypothetical protein